jgi:hypothetical protein
MSDEAIKWPTLGDKFATWDAACDKCGESFPADTRILAVWSWPSRFFISCQCSPQNWVVMDGSP